MPRHRCGFVHLECLADYAETKSKLASDTNKFSNPWRVCPSCHQKYQNELAIDIANKFVPFVRGKYPDDTQRQVESLYVKLCALMGMFPHRLQPVQKRETGVTADVLLSMIYRMKNESPLLGIIPKWKQTHTTPMDLLLSLREQKKVQGGLWLILKCI